MLSWTCSVLRRLLIVMLLGLIAISVSAQPQSAPITTVDALLTQLSGLQGIRAKYVEEKKIAMLKRPLRSEGTVLFAAPGLLLRRVEQPEKSAMLLDGEVLKVSDASGVRTIELGESPIVRHFVLTFVYVLRGDRSALEKLYTLSFKALEGQGEGQGQAWQLELVPKQADLKRFVARAQLQGHGVIVDRMTLLEETGDSTVMQFSEVDPRVRFEPADRARLFRLKE